MKVVVVALALVSATALPLSAQAAKRVAATLSATELVKGIYLQLVERYPGE